MASQLAEVTWLRDLAFFLGLNWGFENCKTLAHNVSQLGIKIEIASVNLLRIPATALQSLGRLGIKKFPDVM
jgi:hypothetical protein